MSGADALREAARALAAAARALDVAADEVERGRPSGGYLDTQGVADLLATTRERIHKLTASGALRVAARDGRRPLYDRADVEDYLRRDA